jgi:hypothetical protein
MNQINSTSSKAATIANTMAQINPLSDSTAAKSGASFAHVSAATDLAGTAASLQATATGKEILAGPVIRAGKDGKVYQLQLENTSKGPAVRVNVSGPGSQIYIGQDKFEQYCARYGIADNPFPLGK